MHLCVPPNVFQISESATVESLCLPLPQMWAPGNRAGCQVPQQPGRTCDSPSGCKPRTGAPLHHPVKTKTDLSVRVCACEYRRYVSERTPIHAHTCANLLIRGDSITGALTVCSCCSVPQ